MKIETNINKNLNKMAKYITQTALSCGNILGVCSFISIIHVSVIIGLN